MLFLKLFVCLTTLYVAFAAVAFVPIEEKPAKFANVSGCYLSNYDMMVGFGDTFSPADGSSCIQYYCNDDGQAHHVGCVPLGSSLDCAEPGDGSLAFPECCRKIVCQQN